MDDYIHISTYILLLPFHFLLPSSLFFFRRAQIRDGSTRRIVREKQKIQTFLFFSSSFTPRFVTVSIDFFECVSIDSARTIRAQSGIFFYFFGKLYKIRYFLRGRDRMMVRIFSSTQRLDVFFFSSSDEFPKGRATTTIQRYVMERDTPHLIPCRMRPLQRRVCV
jgi:hypothetical protein